jgi:hypothetical protein
MRASSFSNADVIGLVSQYFVPVWTSNDDYARSKKQPAEAEELLRVKRLAAGKGLVAGNVNVYLLDTDGGVIDTMGVGKAMEAENLLPWLRKFVADKGLKSRSPQAVQASARPTLPVPGPQTPGGLVLHVWTRYLPPNEVEKGNTDDFVEVTAAEQAGLAPPANGKPGATWEVPRATAEKIASFFYPAVCHYDAHASKVRSASLTATLTSETPQEVQVALRGSVELDHSRDGNIDGRVTAPILGLVRYDPGRKAVASLQLLSEKAEYVWHWEGRPSTSKIAVVVESVSRPEPHRTSQAPPRGSDRTAKVGP